MLRLPSPTKISFSVHHFTSLLSLVNEPRRPFSQNKSKSWSKFPDIIESQSLMWFNHFLFVSTVLVSTSHRNSFSANPWEQIIFQNFIFQEEKKKSRRKFSWLETISGKLSPNRGEFQPDRFFKFVEFHQRLDSLLPATVQRRHRSKIILHETWHSGRAADWKKTIFSRLRPQVEGRWYACCH